MSEDWSEKYGNAYQNLLRKPIKFRKKITKNFSTNEKNMKHNDFNISGGICQGSRPQGNSLEVEPIRTPEAPVNSEKNNRSSNGSEYHNLKLGNDDLRSFTKAELSHRKAQRENVRLQIQKRAALTHRQRVSDFNERLSLLPEHFDIPKVGPG
ncbi:hypothetical protein FG379_002285 [Cryptosporidium bovis]|uniref:uncharacterized protein n=1 Tax=Cryptosporidium bovis TaxID=310047 RepID=UPI00351A74B5|nr:hypothetical protein FG379_002285 [Cryptosporidium bovis]